MSTLNIIPKKIKSHNLLNTTLSRIRDPRIVYLLKTIQDNQIKVAHCLLEEIHKLETYAKWILGNKQFD